MTGNLNLNVFDLDMESLEECLTDAIKEIEDGYDVVFVTYFYDGGRNGKDTGFIDFLKKCGVDTRDRKYNRLIVLMYHHLYSYSKQLNEFIRSEYNIKDYEVMLMPVKTMFSQDILVYLKKT